MGKRKGRPCTDAESKEAVATYFAVKDEDAGLLKYAGMMGHEFIGITGKLGGRVLACEANSLESAVSLVDDDTLSVYRKTPRGWVGCHIPRKAEGRDER